jgi:hypothetical protein
MIVLEECGGTEVLHKISCLEKVVPATFKEWEEIQDLLYKQACEYNRLTNDVYFPKFPTPPEAPPSCFTGL